MGDPRPQPFGKHDRLQLVDGLFQKVVHQNIVVLIVILNLTTGRDQRRQITSSESWPRLRNRHSSVSRSGGKMKMLTASGSFFLICAAPCTSMSSSRSCAFALRLAQEAARRPVVVAEDFGVFQKLVLAESSPRISDARRRSIRAHSVHCRAAGAWCRRWKTPDRAPALRSSLTSVDFPEPGWRRNDVTTFDHSRFCTCSRDFLDFRLHGQSHLGNLQCLAGQAGGLRKQRVGLAIHLLQQEIQFLADFAALRRAVRGSAGHGFRSRTSSSWMSLRSTSNAASCNRRS